MIHFPPLIGYPNYPGFNYIVKKMIKEAAILEKNHFDAIMIENNYDIPHKEKIPPGFSKCKDFGGGYIIDLHRLFG